MNARFSPAERQALLALKGVGPTVVQRLEEIGYATLASLANADPAALTRRIAEHLAAPCWQNSPQARAAMTAIVARARESAT